MEVGQLVQLCDVIPVGVRQPAGTRVVHLALPIQHLRQERGARDWTEREHPPKNDLFFFNDGKAQMSPA